MHLHVHNFFSVRVKATAFRQFFENNPDSLLRMVQVLKPLPSFLLSITSCSLHIHLQLSIVVQLILKYVRAENAH